ncbi:MAG TPA: gamma-glutamyl-gamma-aminobutyrate hydrolase family protein [Bacteroidia bacterium]|nr:gamma-glutamyl-gamma-aminobutyrate hydrolase family protein [Bacteroidia bacterium]
MIAIIDFGSRKTPLIAEMVSACGKENALIGWNDFSLEKIASSSAIIFSGSPAMFTEADRTPYFEKFNFIKEGRIPVLGICFGHQLLGLLHGATIFRGKEITETIRIKVLKKDPLFEGLFPETEMKEDHTEGITLPPGFVHLATSSTYTVEGMRHPFLPLWGVQFHPEVSGENGKKLVGNFCSLVS